MLKRYQFKQFPIRLILFVVVLNLIGIAVVGSARESVQKTQIMGMIMGLVIMAAVALIDYSFILKFHWVIYAGNIGLLALVKFTKLGHASGGAQRWLNIGGFRFQPSEVSKICIILFFAWFFGKYHEKINNWKTIIASAVLIFIPWILILKQPALSISIVTAMVFLAMLFLAGLSYKIILAALAVVIPAGAIFIALIIQPDQKILEHFQWRRIMSWLQPEKYSTDAYQQQNAIMAIGSGQLTGKGLGNDAPLSVKNGNFVPEPHTDFIFAVVGEELGFVGAIIILFLLLLIVLECIIIGRKAKDFQGRLICGGVAALIGFQAFCHVCVVTGLMPNTGITLPFVSYGLTSLVSLYIAIGLVVNVALQPPKYRMGDDFL